MTVRTRDVSAMRALLARFRRMSFASHRDVEAPQLTRDEICRDFETFINDFARRDAPADAGVFMTGRGASAKGRPFLAETRSRPPRAA
jgi:hypothetical protein